MLTVGGDIIFARVFAPLDHFGGNLLAHIGGTIGLVSSDPCVPDSAPVVLDFGSIDFEIHLNCPSGFPRSSNLQSGWPIKPAPARDSRRHTGGRSNDHPVIVTIAGKPHSIFAVFVMVVFVALSSPLTT